MSFNSHVSSDTPADVLIVDDTPGNLQVLSAHLSSAGHKVRVLPRGDMVQAAIAKRRPDIILLDIMMPQMSGYDVADMLQANADTAEIPVVFISGLGDTHAKIQAFERGGIDYIVKPFERDEVLARVRVHVELARTKAQLRAKLAEVEHLNRRLHRVNEALLTENTMDALTKLGNRRHFDATLLREWQPALANNESLGLILTDIDHFKQVNDCFGHALGDAVLQQVGSLLEKSTRDSDVVCRYGGEEFAILLPSTSVSVAAEVAERVRMNVAAYPWHTLHPELTLTMSFGVASTAALLVSASPTLELSTSASSTPASPTSESSTPQPPTSESSTPQPPTPQPPTSGAASPAEAITHKQLIEAADAELYRAKRGGRNQVCVLERP